MLELIISFNDFLTSFILNIKDIWNNLDTFDFTQYEFKWHKSKITILLESADFENSKNQIDWCFLILFYFLFLRYFWIVAGMLDDLLKKLLKQFLKNL